MKTEEKCRKFTILPELIVKKWKQDDLNYYSYMINWLGFETGIEGYYN